MKPILDHIEKTVKLDKKFHWLQPRENCLQLRRKYKKILLLQITPSREQQIKIWTKKYVDDPCSLSGIIYLIHPSDPELFDKIEEIIETMV